MASGNAGRKRVRFNESWTNISVERSNIVITMHTHVIGRRAETVSTPPVLPLAAFLINLPSRESCARGLCLPTQAEVDAYINSLEHDLAATQKRILQVEGTKKIKVPKAPHTKSSIYWWWVVAALIGCIYWLWGS